MIPVTYIPPEMQRQLERNRRAIAGKPYERFFDPQIELRAEIVETLNSGPIAGADMLGTSPDKLNRLLEPGYLAYEQLVHDQTEFTHLAGLLPGIHEAFGPG